MDEVMRCLQGSLAQAAVVRVRALQLRMDMVGLVGFEDCSLPLGSPIHLLGILVDPCER